MGWLDYYLLLEKHSGDLSKATAQELQEAARRNPNTPEIARQVAEQKWNQQHPKLMETIKVSNHALKLIPQDRVIIFCQMWEDSNISGYEQAKIECQKIGAGVMLLTGDYITPQCVTDRDWRTDEDHRHVVECDVYDPSYAVAWVSTITWNECGEHVMKADQTWREWANTCKVKKMEARNG